MRKKFAEKIDSKDKSNALTVRRMPAFNANRSGMMVLRAENSTKLAIDFTYSVQM